jgi:hypothetical protein
MIDRFLNTEYEWVYSLDAVQDDVTSSHYDSRTALYRQISSERECEILHLYNMMKRHSHVPLCTIPATFKGQ